MFSFVPEEHVKKLEAFLSEPRPKGRGIVWKGLRDPSQNGFKLPGPEGSGFL